MAEANRCRVVDLVSGVGTWVFVRGDEIRCRLKRACTKLHADCDGGAGPVDIAIYATIAVVIGMAVLAVLKTRMPQFFEGVFDKIEGWCNAETG